MRKLITFHGDPFIKEKYLTRLRLPREQDEITKGVYWENGKGYAVGCTIHGIDHSAAEDQLGISRIIARLEDRIFEGLPNRISKDFPIQFLEAVPVGVDVGIVFYKFMHWLLIDPQDGVINFTNRPESKRSINEIADLYQKIISSKRVSAAQYKLVLSIVNATFAAADYSADAADYAAVEYAVSYATYYAAKAAEYAADYVPVDWAAELAAEYADYATYYAAKAASRGAIKSKCIEKQADKLIQLLKGCKF